MLVFTALCVPVIIPMSNASGSHFENLCHFFYSLVTVVSHELFSANFKCLNLEKSDF